MMANSQPRLGIRQSRDSSEWRAGGFTRIEALALLGALVIVATVSTPLAANTRTHSRLAQCLANLSQVQRAWSLYADDHHGRLVSPTAAADVSTRPDWVNGTWIDFTPGNPANLDTNRFPVGSPLWAYSSRDASIFRCPDDPARLRVPRSEDPSLVMPRTRSYAMNSWLSGTTPWPDAGSEAFRLVTSLEDLVDPGPSRTYVFIDEREESINDGALLVSMAGFPVGGVASQGSYRIIDFPADWHDGCAAVTFADGHIEARRWLDSRTTPPHRSANLFPLNIASPNNPDVAWLQERSTSRGR
ncbi:MAG: hypothetical protein IT581_21855 [Verrucomicrobiales bacterium]|nr:hypothetical protein [Verrucomicrobiales bacterium]